MDGVKKEQGNLVEIREGFYFMEVCDKVQAINIVLREKDFPLSVFVEPRRILTQSYTGNITFYPLTLEVEPSSCTSMQFNRQEGLSMRLQLRSAEEVPPAHVPMGTLIERLTSAFERLNGQTCTCGCKTCGMNLLKEEVKFKRVLNLPSKNWEDLSSSWTCCSHKCRPTETGKHSTQKYPFVPRTGEFFMDEFFVIFHPEAVLINNVLLCSPEKDGTGPKAKKENYETSLTKCGRCLSIVGEAIIVDSKTVLTYNFYKSAIEYRSFCKDNPLPIFNSAFFLERVLANVILDEVEMNATYRFVLLDEKKMPQMLIRVLNVDSRIRFHYSRCDKPRTPSSAFGCCAISSRYLGSEDWDLTTPRVSKAGKEKAISTSAKHIGKFFFSFDTMNEVIEEMYARNNENAPMQQAPIKNLTPPDVSTLYKFSSNTLSVGRTCEDGAVDDVCGLERVIKVMYASATTTQGAKMAKEWQNDIHVCPLTFPHAICMQTMLLLTTSTLSLPMTRRIAPDDFLFGILRIE